MRGMPRDRSRARPAGTARMDRKAICRSTHTHTQTHAHAHMHTHTNTHAPAPARAARTPFPRGAWEKVTVGVAAGQGSSRRVTAGHGGGSRRWVTAGHGGGSRRVTAGHGGGRRPCRPRSARWRPPAAGGSPTRPTPPGPGKYTKI